MTCSHPAGTITDHAVHGIEGPAIRYAWRGNCVACQHGVVGVTALPPNLPLDRLKARLTTELMAYLNYSASTASA